MAQLEGSLVRNRGIKGAKKKKKSPSAFWGTFDQWRLTMPLPLGPGPGAEYPSGDRVLNSELLALPVGVSLTPKTTRTRGSEVGT